MASSYIARNSPRRAGATLIALVVLSASGCGDDSVSVDEYANDLCTALTGWTETLRDRQAELQEGAGTGGTPQEDREALQEFVDGAAAASDALVEDVEAAGVPDIEDGEEVADAFQAAVEETRTEIQEARDDVGEIPTDSAEAYRTAVDEFVTDLRATLEGIGEHFQDVDAPELDMALDEASACQG